jgi:hypothetical protein
VFLHGFASTNERSGEVERVIYECLLRTFPTPESVLEKDLGTLKNEQGCQNLLNPNASAGWMKRNAENWENIKPLLRCRTRAEQDAIRNFIEDPKNQNKRLVKEFVGAGYKGSDMTLLWGGCEVPVIDKQMMRYLAPHMLGEDWDTHILKLLARRKADKKQLSLGMRADPGPIRSIDADEIQLDNPTHFTAEEEAFAGKIQSTVGRYGAWRDLAYQMADAEGIPVSIWHVATWLEYRTVVDGKRGDPDSPRANPKILARAKRFVERTYGPSDGPSAVTDDQWRYLRDEIDGLRSYGLRHETVEPKRGSAYILHWSNAQAQWYVFPQRKKVGTSVQLDANEFLGYGRLADLKEVAPKLQTLPLYYSGPSGGSTEYKHQQRLGGRQDPGAYLWEDIREHAEDNPDLDNLELAEEFAVDSSIVSRALAREPAIDRSAQQIRYNDIRELAVTSAGVNKSELAADFGVDIRTVNKALDQSPAIIIPPYGSGRGYGRASVALTLPSLDEKTIEIRKYTITRPGVSQATIASELGLTKDQVNYALAQEPRILTSSPAHEKEYLEGMEGRRFPWGRPPLPHPPPHILGQLEELKTRAEKEAGMNPELYEDIVDWFLHHPDHNEIDLRTRGSHFEQAVGGHARAGGRVGASVGATVRHFSDKQLREYFAPLLEWTEIAGQNIPGHPHPRPRILRSKDRRTRLVGFTSPPHLADARARPPIGWKPLEQPRPRTDQPDYGYPPSEGYTGFPGAFVGFETPFGFDDNITVMWKDWVQYKIADTPVVVKRVGAKPGTKVNPKYKGATAPQELHIDFRLRASNRKDMQKIDFLLERLREDNPTMAVRVNVKTNGQTARRNLPSWQERPYRLEPAAWLPQDEGPSASAPSAPSAFTGIEQYANAIMELV